MIQIEFAFIDDSHEAFTVTSWPTIPRKGDTFCYQNDLFLVTEVAWGGHSPDGKTTVWGHPSVTICLTTQGSGSHESEIDPFDDLVETAETALDAYRSGADGTLEAQLEILPLLAKKCREIHRSKKS